MEARANGDYIDSELMEARAAAETIESECYVYFKRPLEWNFDGLVEGMRKRRTLLR